MKRVNILKRTSLIINKVDILCKKINHNDFSNEAKSKLQLVREALIKFKSWIDFEFSQHKSIKQEHESIDNLPVNVPTIELINTNENVETEDSCNVKNEISEANIKEEIDDELIEEDSFVFASNIAGKPSHKKKKRICGPGCGACLRPVCRNCSNCKNKRRCKERYCEKYKEIVKANSKTIMGKNKCNKCHRTFSSHGSLSRHEAKSNCGRLAKKWGNLPHKCLLCLESPLFENHNHLIIHTNITHSGKIRYSVRCPMLMTCEKFIKPNNISRHIKDHEKKAKMQKCSVNIEKIPWNLEKIEKSIHLESFDSIDNLNSSLETIDQNNTELPNEELENNEQIDIKHEFNSENEINELINKNVEEVDYDQIFDGEEIYFEGLNDESQSYNEDLQSDNEEMLDEKINDEESFTFANNIEDIPVPEINMKLKVCGPSCDNCLKPPCRKCKKCLSRKRCIERYCEKYTEMIRAQTQRERICYECNQAFSSTASLKRHKMKGSCYKEAQMYKKHPVVCVEDNCDTRSFQNFDEFRKHKFSTNPQHKKFKYKCLKCPLMYLPNNIKRHIEQHKNETEGKKFPMKKSTNETNVKNLETDEKASNSSAAHETPLDSDTLDITNIGVKEIFIPVKNILAKENVKEAKSIKRKRKYINNFCRSDCEICNRPNCKNCTNCQHKKRCKLRYCEAYIQQLKNHKPDINEFLTCTTCGRYFSQISNLRRHVKNDTCARKITSSVKKRVNQDG